LVELVYLVASFFFSACVHDPDTNRLTFLSTAIQGTKLLTVDVVTGAVVYETAFLPWIGHKLINFFEWVNASSGQLFVSYEEGTRTQSRLEASVVFIIHV
jgi:hypothetical protein